MSVSLHTLLQEIAETRDYPSGINSLENFLAQAPHDVAAKVELAYLLELVGRSQAALEQYISIDLTTHRVLYERVVHRKILCLLRLGRENEALALFREALDASTSSFWIYAEYVRYLNRQSRVVDPLELQRMWLLCGSHTDCQPLIENIFLYLYRLDQLNLTNLIFEETFSHGVLIDELKTLYSSGAPRKALTFTEQHALLHHEEVFDRMLDLAERREPFSLIRLGDGEGNFILGNSSLRECTIISRYYQHILFNWFGTKTIERGPELFDLLIDSIRAADVCGVPNVARLKYEAREDSRGFWGCVGVFDVFDAEGRTSPQMLCNSNIHEMLFKSATFLSVIDKFDTVWTISCHSEFGALIRGRLGKDKGQDMLCPGEFGIVELPHHKKGNGHWPTTFEKIAVEIRNMPAHSLVFVAAGVLGKIYCGLAKQAGCFAVDIGALADWFCGDKTRTLFKTKTFGQDFLI